MNRYEAHLLQQISSYPALTITVPTHRTSPDNRQDPIRVKNLVEQAGTRLLAEFSKREIAPLLANLEKLVEEIDYRYTLDGLALFVNRDFARTVQLPFTLKEHVHVGETFLARDLVFAMNRTPRYWVLVLSEKPTRLYEATRDDLIEIQDGGFPITHEGPGGEQSLPGGFGIKKSAYRDERHRQFFRKVDDVLKPFLANDPQPLIVAGVERYLAFFNEVSADTKFVSGTITGSHDKTSPYKLSQLIRPLIEKHQAEKRQEALEQLERAVSERKFVSAIGEVWRLAHEGSGALLLVEEDFHYPARLDENGVLIPAEAPAGSSVIDDAVDEIIDTVLNQQGKVVFVENGKLDEHRHIAMILRY